jgi:hypothetical protein
VVTEIKEVASVAGNVITFTLPLMIDYPVSKASQVIRYTGVHVHSQFSGVEDLTVTGGTNGGVRITTAANSWVLRVECRNFIGPCIDILDAYKIEIRESYLHHAYNPVPGGGGYAISLKNGASNILIEDNIVLYGNKMMVGRASGAGSVVGYNYMQDALINYNQEFMEVGINASHYPAPHHVLFEGNQSHNYDSDFTFGSSIYMTVFRNWLEGERRTLPSVIGRGYRAAGLMEGSWWHAFYGNVLGRPVFVEPESSWIYDDPCDGTATAGDIACDVNHAAIWRLGYSSINSQLADSGTRSRVIRDGNWDFLTDSLHWDGAPTTIQNSLYLSAKPAFFGSEPWPWVDPQGTAKIHTLPARVRYDAIAARVRARVRVRTP